jgi:hypothetical protein
VEQDRLTILVFKDNRTARTFQVPLKWINRIGLIFTLICVFTVGATLLAGKFYYTARSGNPAKINDLEREIDELHTQLQTTETKTAPQPSPVAANNMTVQVPDPATLPFKIEQISTNWLGATLKIHFAIQYSKPDGGSQQGRVVIIARGPDGVFVYPSGALNVAPTTITVSPEQGEYFSVSRFREVNAEFRTSTPSAITDAEIMLFDEDEKLIYLNHLSVGRKAPEKKQGV